jgi:uncharacterized membrane protein
LSIYLTLIIAISSAAGLIGISGLIMYKYENKILQATIIEYEKHNTKVGVTLLRLENKMVKANENHRENIDAINSDGYVYPACGLYTFTKHNKQNCKNKSKSN